MKMRFSSSSLASENTPNMFRSSKQRKNELLFICSLFITGGIIILCPSFYSNTSFSTVKESYNETLPDMIPEHPSNGGYKEDCDYSKGKWVWDTERNIYNSSEWICPTRPTGYNCEVNGKDLEYLNWRWKPDGCDLPKFEPYSFLNIIRGKTLAFVGDSLSLNQLNSLFCLVSQVEKPIEILDEMIEGKFFTWSFPLHEARLSFVWSRFLVEAKQLVEKGEQIDVYEVHLDKINTMFASLLPKFHYLVLSSGNWWFSKKIYLHEGGKLIGCINCKDEKKLTKHETKHGLQKAFRTVFQYISKCEECKDLFTLLRTYSPSHFEKGSWFDGGYCRRSHPLENEENAKQELMSQWRTCEEFREVQMEELGRVRRNEEGGGKRKRYGVVDVSRASMLRVDAHPGFYYSDLVRRNVTDCLHWCMPGPPDMWNEILLEILKKDSLH